MTAVEPARRAGPLRSRDVCRNMRTPVTALPFDNSYARLPERFYARLAPTAVIAPRLIALNEPLARRMGWDPDALSTPEGVAMLAGNCVPPAAAPLAMAYAGHQFGQFVPRLGDGRAILLGETMGIDGVRRDVHLKGAGPTPFSRRGDGRAALGPALREYLVSEAMAALRVPTTRALALVATGEHVWRDTALAGAIVVRVAESHVRAGTFQYFAARGDEEAVRLLADYVIARNYPATEQAPQRYRALLGAVVARQASLIARWLCLGFVHGVMNTDNMSIAGETIDFGPCAFLDAYVPDKVFSSIDAGGRYAFNNQRRIAAWNLARLAECLLPLLGGDEAERVEAANAELAGFAPRFEAAYTDGLRAKLGLITQRDGDLALASDLLERMAEGRADFTRVFRALCAAALDPDADEVVRSEFSSPALYDGWAPAWRARLAAEDGDPTGRAAAMQKANPALIPRNHRVEEAIAAAYAGDFSPFERLRRALADPYTDHAEFGDLAKAPTPDEEVSETFCGT